MARRDVRPSRLRSGKLWLLALWQQTEQITLPGSAASDRFVLAHARTLEMSARLEGVVVQSVNTLATPFAATTSTDAVTLTAAAGGLASTVDPRDSYEPADDWA